MDSEGITTVNAETTLALCRWLEKRVKEWSEQARAQLGLLPGERKAAVVGDRVIGHVSMVKGRRRAVVVSEEALLAYVQQRYPSEVETVTQIRPAFRKRLLDEAVTRGALVDSGGAVVDGIVDVVDGDPYPTVRFADDADTVIPSLIAQGRLQIGGEVRELAGGEG